MLKACIKNDKGMALAVVLMSFAVIALIATVSMSVAIGDVRQGVSSQDYMDASYVARSAADVVSLDVERKLDELVTLQTAIGSASGTGIQTAIDNYDAKWNEIQALHLIPAAGGTYSIYVNGLATSPVKVDVINKTSGSSVLIEVHSTYQNNLRNGNAKIRLGTFVTATEDYTIPAFDGRNALYSWGDIEIGNGNPTIIGYVSCGGDIDSKKITGTEGDLRSISIIPPPSTVSTIIKNPSAKRTSIINGNATTLDSNDNGNYGSISTNKLDLTVDTSKGDVIMILSSLSINKSGGKITVNGEGNFYIYFKENYSSSINSTTIMGDDANQLDVIGTNSSGKPQTYFIAYNDYMQKWVSEHSGSEKYIIPTASWAGMSTLDTYNIKNGPTFDAYLYLPFGDLSMKNKATVMGSIYASKIDIKNGTDVTFQPYNENDAIFTGGGDSTIGATTAAIVTTYNLNKNKIWLR